MRRLLIVGCGDIATRMLPALRGRYQVFALLRRDDRADMLRAQGAMPILGDLDLPDTLDRLADIAEDVVHMAPPPEQGARDSRTLHLIRSLARGRSLPRRFVYLSTSGVYGDCGGELVSESRPASPQTDRARRRAHAESQLRRWGGATGVRVSILRVPGIYAGDRLPLQRLRAGTPALRPDQDAYTNHVHAEDLARMVMAALNRGRAGRTYNANDDSDMRMGEYFDMVAAHFGLPPPPRIDRVAAEEVLSPALLSFMRESRRLSNLRLKSELRFVHRYPTVADGLAAMGAGSGQWPAGIAAPKHR